MAALYGLSTLAIGVATGVDASPDMAGEAVEPLNGLHFLATPPLTILLDQHMVENTVRTTDGEKRQKTHCEQEFLGVTCSANDEGVTLYGLEIEVHLDTPNSGTLQTGSSAFYQQFLTYSCFLLVVPVRKSCVLLEWKKGDLNDLEVDEADQAPSKKRRKLQGDLDSQNQDSTRNGNGMAEIQKFASMIDSTLDLDD